jgi:ribonuclease HI
MAALKDAAGAVCEIQTDSEFWVKVLTEWAPRWQAADWQKKGGIKNLDIVQPLFGLYQQSRARLIWTRGHVGTELNELADEWANQARRQHVRAVVAVSTIAP